MIIFKKSRINFHECFFSFRFYHKMNKMNNMNDKLYNRDEIFRRGDENYSKNMMGENFR